jgi:protein tyrosine/serine phosphatase
MQRGMSETDRKLRLEGVENFRDYGGYDTASGRRIRRGLLFRSANWSAPTDADFEAINALGLTHVVDLRRQGERETNPARRPTDFTAEIIDNALMEEVEDGYLHFIQTGELTVPAMQAFLTEYNRNAPFEPRHIDLFRRYFKALGEGEGAILIHCAAGKDRTGLLAALTHHLAGVSHEDIVADYLLTNDEARLAVRAPLYAAWIEETTGRKPSIEFVRATLGVERRFIETAFAVIEEKYGTVDAYLRDVLGVDDALKAKIEARLFAA